MQIKFFFYNLDYIVSDQSLITMSDEVSLHSIIIKVSTFKSIWYYSFGRKNINLSIVFLVKSSNKTLTNISFVLCYNVVSSIVRYHPRKVLAMIH